VSPVRCVLLLAILWPIYNTTPRMSLRRLMPTDFSARCCFSQQTCRAMASWFQRAPAVTTMFPATGEACVSRQVFRASGNLTTTQRASSCARCRISRPQTLQIQTRQSRAAKCFTPGMAAGGVCRVRECALTCFRTLTFTYGFVNILASVIPVCILVRVLLWLSCNQHEW